MLPGILFAVSIVGSTALWIFSIRPYCVKHRQGHHTGANVGVAIWNDWQHAKETASKRGDDGMIAICRVFSTLQILLILGVLLQFI